MPHSALNPSAAIDSPQLWSAGPALLSLALMDARNHTLALLARFEEAEDSGHWRWQPEAGQEPPLWLAGHAGWFAEYWVGRNTRRALGSNCPPDALRLPSLDPSADRLWDPRWRSPAQRAAEALPERAAVRAWLLDTLEATLELLDRLPEEDASLYFFRLALFHEDLLGERLIRLAQAQGVPLDLPEPTVLAARDPLLIPATRWTLPHRSGGFHPEGEPGQLSVAVPEFEIDAQAVSWAQYIEFVDDGGYDRAEHWQPEGWAWLQGQAGRSAPRHVEHMGVARQGSSGAVLQNRFGRRVRLAAAHPVVHVSWWEADAWCRWAGRRLPDEVEWDLAAHTAARRGWRWGEVHEWTATRLRPWPGAQPGPWSDYAWPLMEQARVQRGHSVASRARLRDPGWRWFGLPHEDEAFVGFRSCAV